MSPDFKTVTETHTPTAAIADCKAALTSVPKLPDIFQASRPLGTQGS